MKKVIALELFLILMLFLMSKNKFYVLSYAELFNSKKDYVFEFKDTDLKMQLDEESDGNIHKLILNRWDYIR